MSLKAQCACKKVSIELASDPVRCLFCHCDYCQRMTGSVGNAIAVFREDDVVSMTDAFELDPEMEQWPGVKKYCCPKCYSTVHWVNPTAFPDMRLVSLGCLEKPSDFNLGNTVQNQHRPAWCPPLDADESYEAYP